MTPGPGRLYTPVLTITCKWMELLQFCAAASNFVSANINSLTCIQNLASKRISRLLKVFKVYEAADEYVDMF